MPPAAPVSSTTRLGFAIVFSSRKPIGSAPRLSSMLAAKSKNSEPRILKRVLKRTQESPRESMSSLRIYGIARTRAFRALWMAKELGLDYEHDPVEIGDAGARTPEFLAINPNGRLPVIVDDGFVLFEALAITLYLAKKHSPGRLYPGTLEGEARAWQWSLWAVTEVDRGVNIWSLHAVRLPPPDQNPANAPRP